MGSGLILLAIVGAWLAVLVPMALRRYDASSLGTVDKFHDAMRVLARRDSSSREPAAEEPEPAPAEPGRIRTAAAGLRRRLATRRERRPMTPARRRRRLLLVLVVLSVATLVGAIVGPLWLLAPHLQVDLLLGAFLVHLRRTAVARAEREWRTAMAQRPARRPAPVVAEAAPVAPPAPVLRVPVHVAGIPDRMPSRADVGASCPVMAPVEQPAARGAQGAPWSPVPVPVPTYVTAPTAPRPSAPPAAAADGLADAERDLGIVDSGPELDEILDRRRAVNDW